MKIVVDLDGTVCALREDGETYADVAPLPGAVDKLKALKAAGHYIILFTARHMVTCGSNVGLVMARQGKTLFDWLHKHSIPYDEIYFGKPHGDIYIDDNGFRFEGWDRIADDGSNLPISSEKRMNAAPGKSR
jgi:capsule biosynthesis phosphatase